jgi:hypothetical protein
MSRGARAYAIDIVLTKLIVALIELYPDIPVCSQAGGLPAAVRAIWDRWKCFEDQVFLPMSAMAKRVPQPQPPTERTVHRGGIDRRFLMNVLAKEPKAAANIEAKSQTTGGKWYHDAA